MLRHRGHLSDLAHRVQMSSTADTADRCCCPSWPGEPGVSERTLTRIFTAATG